MAKLPDSKGLSMFKLPGGCAEADGPIVEDGSDEIFCGRRIACDQGSDGVCALSVLRPLLTTQAACARRAARLRVCARPPARNTRCARTRAPPAPNTSMGVARMGSRAYGEACDICNSAHRPTGLDRLFSRLGSTLADSKQHLLPNSPHVCPRLG